MIISIQRLRIQNSTTRCSIKQISLKSVSRHVADGQAISIVLLLTSVAVSGNAEAGDAGDADEDAELQAALAMSMQTEEPSSANGGAPATGGVGLSPALQSLIQNIQTQARGSSRLQLSMVLDSVALIDAVKNDTTVQDMLVVHMPDELQTRDELLAFISSPQFRQTIDSLATVLSTEQMYTVLASMGIPMDAAPFPGVEGFLQALISTLSKKPSTGEGSTAGKSAEDDDLDADLYD